MGDFVGIVRATVIFDELVKKRKKKKKKKTKKKKKKKKKKKTKKKQKKGKTIFIYLANARTSMCLPYFSCAHFVYLM